MQTLVRCFAVVLLSVGVLGLRISSPGEGVGIVSGDDPEPPGIPIPATEPPFVNGIIRDFRTEYRSNAAYWSVQTDLRDGILNYGDRKYVLRDIPPSLVGAEWVRPANNSKRYLFNTLCSFKLTAEADVYLAHSDAVTRKPEWLKTMGWVDSGLNCSNSDGEQFSLYVKKYAAGATARLGPNGGDVCCYFVIAKARGERPAGNLISELVCFDRAGFEIADRVKQGARCYSDRPYAFTSVAPSLEGCEYIRPPNNAKTHTRSPLAAFVVAADAEVYIAHCDRITPKPAWLTLDYIETGETVTNDDPMPKTFKLFKRRFPAGSTVTLGPNGNTELACYIVFVKRTTNDQTMQFFRRPGAPSCGENRGPFRQGR